MPKPQNFTSWMVLALFGVECGAVLAFTYAETLNPIPLILAFVFWIIGACAITRLQYAYEAAVRKASEGEDHP